jgi:hypothetical protein
VVIQAGHECLSTLMHKACAYEACEKVDQVTRNGDGRKVPVTHKDSKIERPDRELNARRAHYPFGFQQWQQNHEMQLVNREAHKP